MRTIVAVSLALAGLPAHNVQTAVITELRRTVGLQTIAVNVTIDDILDT